MAPIIMLSLAAFCPADVTLGPFDKSDKRSSLLPGLMAGLLGLALGAWREFRELVFDQLVGLYALIAVIVGASFASLAARIDKKQAGDSLMIFLIGGASAVWAAGIFVEVNGHLPARGFIQTPVQVADKQEWHGGRGSTSYHLFLRTNPTKAAGAMTVSKPIFDRASIGDELCVIRTAGALNLRWWRVGECQRTVKVR